MIGVLLAAVMSLAPMRSGDVNYRSMRPFDDASWVWTEEADGADFFPFPGGLRAVKAKTPHPLGLVETDLRFDGVAVKGKVTLPAGVDGVFVWKGIEHPLATGANAIDF